MNLDNCNKIKTKAIQDYCTSEVLVLNKDPRCDLIKFLKYRNKCYYKIAISIKNSLLCEKVFNNDFMRREYLIEITKENLGN